MAEPVESAPSLDPIMTVRIGVDLYPLRSGSPLTRAETCAGFRCADGLRTPATA